MTVIVDASALGRLLPGDGPKALSRITVEIWIAAGSARTRSTLVTGDRAPARATGVILPFDRVP